MKNLLLISIVSLISGFASAQTDTKIPPASEKPAVVKVQADTISTNQELQNESDLKTMDAVKTQNHPKTTPQVAKDTVVKKTKRKGRGQVAKP